MLLLPRAGEAAGELSEKQLSGEAALSSCMLAAEESQETSSAFAEATCGDFL